MSTIPIFHFDNVESTQDRAKQILLSSKSKTVLVFCDQQTKGRGQNGREWLSRLGNLYATIGFLGSYKIEDLSGLSLICGYLVLKALNLDQYGIKLKWPNDLVHMPSKKKLGGILIEIIPAEIEQKIILVGIGINLESALNINRAVCLKELGVVDLDFISYSARYDLVVKLIDEFSLLDLNHLTVQKNRYLSNWMNHCAHLPDSKLVINSGGILEEGKFAGINNYGELMLNTNTGFISYNSASIMEW